MTARVLAGLVGLILLGGERVASAQPTQVLHEFTGYVFAEGPTAPLILATDGNLYGTTKQTGEAHRGTIFRMTPSGTVTTLHNFIGGDDGAEPVAGLLQASDGYFYGTTTSGGAFDAGTVFRMAPGGQLNVLHVFAGSPDGARPSAALIGAADGSFYGTTSEGGDTDKGTVFRMTGDGTVVVLHSFAGRPSDGALPGLITRTADGVVYGVTRDGGIGPSCPGGACAQGTVFKMTPDGATTILHSFAGSPTGDGSHPTSIGLGHDGNLYGTTEYGGSNFGLTDNCPFCGGGTIFRMTPGGAVSIVHAFTGADGESPIGGLLQAQDGRLYGTTSSGGGPSAGGVVFAVTPSGVFTILHVFRGATTDGSFSEASLVQLPDGTMYGTTPSGGVSFGVAFKLDAGGTYSVVHIFKGSVEGAYPHGPLVQASDGNFYGATQGGAYNRGTIFRMTPAGGTTVAYTFAGGLDGGYPNGGLVQGRDGNLYGTTYRNGAYDAGTIFRLTLTGQLTTLHWFRGNEDGGFPSAGLVQARDGSFYGTTYGGGTFNQGTVFRMTPDGEVTVMHHFVGASDGALPTTALLQARDGNLYGTTSGGGYPFYSGTGTVYRPTPYGDYAVLHRFDVVNEGGDPHASLVQGTDNSLYGATACGIPGRGGALFRLTFSGTTIPLAFNQGSCGEYGNNLSDALVSAFDGTLYWTTGNSVFALSPSGAWRLVDSMCCGDLMQAANGQFYGTGVRVTGAGTVFRLGSQPAPVVSHARSVLGDFDGDGKVDLVWRQQLPFGDLAVWLMDGVQPKQGPVLEYGLYMGITIAGVGDLDGDGKADLIWRYAWDGTVVAWLMNGPTLKQFVTIASSVPLAWQIVGVADLDGDHKADLIWRHTETGAVAVWLMDGATVKEAPVVAPAVPLAWQIAGVGDLDGDGKADLVWRHTQSGDVAIWLMDGVTVKEAPVVAPGVPLAWEIAGVGDLDGDGKADLVWRHTRSGDVAVWLMDGLIATHTPVIATAVPLAWQIAGVGDLDADGKADLIWRQTETGDLAAWLMSGASVKQSEVVAPHVPLTWQID